MRTLEVLAERIKVIKTALPDCKIRQFTCGTAAYKKFKEAVEEKVAIQLMGSFHYQGVPVCLESYDGFGRSPNDAKIIIELTSELWA